MLIFVFEYWSSLLISLFQDNLSLCSGVIDSLVSAFTLFILVMGVSFVILHFWLSPVISAVASSVFLLCPSFVSFPCLYLIWVPCSLPVPVLNISFDVSVSLLQFLPVWFFSFVLINLCIVSLSDWSFMLCSRVRPSVLLPVDIYALQSCLLLSVSACALHSGSLRSVPYQGWSFILDLLA